jgi:predicted permease
MTWLWRLFHRRALERDLDKELRFHVDAAADDFVRGGMRPDEARRLARLQLGGVEQVKESTRDARGTRWLEDLVTDARHSLRAMRRAPGLSLAAILTLAIGIGANTSVWSILDALMRRSLPVERPDELYAIKRAGLQDNYYDLSFPAMERMRAALPDTASIAALSSTARMYFTATDQPDPVTAQLVSGNFFQLLGVPAQLGRTFAPSDERDAAGSPVIVISDDYWERRFGRDSSAVARQVDLNGVPVRIIGVLPAGFAGLTVGSSTDVYAPLTMQSPLKFRGNASASDADFEKPWPEQNGISWLTLITRQPEADRRLVLSRLAAPHRDFLNAILATEDSTSRAYALKEHLELEPIPRGFSPLRDTFGDPLRLLMVSVGLVLLIACANLAGLLLARSAARTQETAVRVSLGAQPGRLVRQALTESLTLAVIGGTTGLLFAQWTTRLLLRLASSGTRPIPLSAGLDLRVLLFTYAVTVLAGLLFGLAPALRAARTDLYDSFKTGGRVVAGSRPRRIPLGRALVMGQIALSLLLITSAGIFIRTFQNLVHIEVGYEREQLVNAQIDVRAAGYTADQLPALEDRLLAGLRALPGVRSASLALYGLASGSVRTSGFNPPGRNLPPAQRTGQENLVAPEWFKTVGISLVKGRDFTPQDSKDAQRVAILTELAAHRFFGTDDVIGKHFGYGSEQPWIIVGVVRDARVNSLRGAPPVMVYRPLAQGQSEFLTSAQIRVTGNVAPVIAEVRSALTQVDRRIPIREVTTMETLLERGLTRERLIARLATGFGILALLLAAIGLYGVISYSVARRTNEMGVRLALGASPAGVSWVVLRDSLVTIASGLAVGLLLWFPLLGLAQRLVYGLSPHDPTSLVIGTASLLAVGLVGSMLPALRASRIDPIEAIRAE